MQPNQKKFKSFLADIGGFGLTSETEIIETRVENAIASVIYINRLIEKYFSEDEAANLKRRLLLSIKNEDSKQFVRGMKLIKESNNGTR